MMARKARHPFEWNFANDFKTASMDNRSETVSAFLQQEICTIQT